MPERLQAGRISFSLSQWINVLNYWKLLSNMFRSFPNYRPIVESIDILMVSPYFCKTQCPYEKGQVIFKSLSLLWPGAL
jgi:hypothetical protein